MVTQALGIGVGVTCPQARRAATPALDRLPACAYEVAAAATRLAAVPPASARPLLPQTTLSAGAAMRWAPSTVPASRTHVPVPPPPRS